MLIWNTLPSSHLERQHIFTKGHCTAATSFLCVSCLCKRPSLRAYTVEVDVLQGPIAQLDVLTIPILVST